MRIRQSLSPLLLRDCRRIVGMLVPLSQRLQKVMVRCSWRVWPRHEWTVAEHLLGLNVLGVQPKVTNKYRFNVWLVVQPGLTAGATDSPEMRTYGPVLL